VKQPVYIPYIQANNSEEEIMTKVLVPVANGSEDIEAITIIDVLRRGGVTVTVASVHDDLQVTLANGCQLTADCLISEQSDAIFDAIALPGGMPGAEHLRNSKILVDLLEKHDIQDALLAAICASPAVVFGTHGFVVDKQATCYPGFESGLTGAEFVADEPVVMDGNILTAKGPAVSMVFALTLLAIFLFGAVKTSSLMNPESDTVKIAAIFLLPEDGQWFDGEGLFSQELSPYEETLSKIETLTATAASSGAKIVAFQENALKIHESDETDLLDRSKAIARENGVYLSLGYGLLFTEGKGWNMNILISDQGELVVDYRKRFLLGIGEFGESGIYNKGPEVIQSVDTTYGRIGVSICRDMSFPGYAQQAGEQRVDIMLNPSYDYPKSTSAMYSLRAIENGFTMIRPVYNGFSYAVDPNGKLLASMDSDNTATGIMYADVPTKGVKTIYTTVGDLLGWLCVFGLLGLILLSIVLSIRKKRKMA
jgi:DJ-1 family protein